jgi:hypothetical protein
MLNKLIVYLLLLLCSNVFGQSIHIRDFTTYDGLPQIQALTITQDDDGYIWVGTKNGLSKFNGKSFKNFTFEDRKYKPSSVQNIFFRNNQVFAASQKAIYKLQNDSLKLIWKHPDSCVVDKIMNNGDYVLANYEQGSYRLFDVTHKLLFTSKKNQGIHWYENGVILIDSTGILLCKDISGNTINSKVGMQRAYIVNGQIYFSFTNKNNEAEVYDARLNLQCRISAKNEISYLNEAYQWNYVKTLDNKNFAFDRKNRKLFPIQICNGNVCQDKDGNLWLNYEPGIHQIVFSPFQYLPYPALKDVWTVEKLTTGNILLGSLTNGLFSMNSLKGINVVNTINTIPNRYYYGSCKNESGLTYLPTSTGMEIRNSISTDIVADVDLGTPILVSKYIKSINKVVAGGRASIFLIDGIKYEKIDLKDWTSSYIIDVEYKDGLIYLSTFHDLLTYDVASKKVESIFLSEENNGAASMCFDDRGNLWIGQINRVLLYDFKNKAKTILEAPIKGIVTDITFEEKKLLIATSSDLIVFDIEKYYRENKIIHKVYNRYSGLLCEEIAQSGMKLIDSMLVIPSYTYTAIVKPSELNIREDFLNLKIIKIGSVSASEVDKVVITNKEALVMFEAIGFNRPTHSEYRTKLNDDQWSAWSQSESVWISNAREGQNTFYVQTRTGDHTGFRETRQTFIVELPFLESSRFYWLMSIFSLLAITFLTWAFRNNFILQTKNNYDRKQLDFLKVSSLQSQMNPHFVFNALGAIQSPILNGDKELAFSLINKLSSLIRKFLDSSVKSDNSINSVDPHTIKEEIELLKLYVDLEHFQYQDKFQYHFDIAPGLESSEEVIPPFIIQPYIENAIKHGLPQEGNGFIFIKMFIEDDAFHVQIEDNGIGIEAAKKQRKEIDHKSYGTMLTKQRIAILNENGSDIHIDEAERNEGGTIIKIRIKISNKHG